MSTVEFLWSSGAADLMRLADKVESLDNGNGFTPPADLLLPNFRMDADPDDGVVGGNIHIYNQQRIGNKSLTTIEGLPKQVDHKKVVKALKKSCNCNGAVVKRWSGAPATSVTIIQIQGDKRSEVAEFLFHQGIAEKEQLKVHGV